MGRVEESGKGGISHRRENNHGVEGKERMGGERWRVRNSK